LGLVDYADGLRVMEFAAGRLRAGQAQDHLFLLEHPHVLTMGRRGGWANLLASGSLLDQLGVERFDVDRGGDVTYHGPGQIVGYPLLALGEHERDVRKYVASVEDVVIATLADFGIEGARGGRGLEGVWVDDAKIAAVGVRLDRWVTTHGFALNVHTDLGKFQLVVPCGLPSPVTSMAQILGAQAPSVSEVKARLAEHAGSLFGRRLIHRAVERESVQVVVHRSAPAGPEWLVLSRNQARGGFDQPVTGMIEGGESPQEAAVRELWEETGQRAEAQELHSLDYVHSFLVEAWTRPDNVEGALVFCREFSFDYRFGQGAELNIDPAEHVGARWLPTEEARAAMLWSGNRRAIGLSLARSQSGPRQELPGLTRGPPVERLES
jgi:lipoyl(octanoyl) transferase